MCGIAGYFSFSGLVENTEALRRMNAAVAHRGPDGEGLVFLRRDTSALQAWQGKPTPMTPGDLAEWKPSDWPHDLALGHRRFAIIDLSPGGHQPFLSRDKTLALTFNGEIYNYVELRRELEQAGQVFHTQSDAEVLLSAYRQWGEACFAKLRGFWALALWDSQRGLLLSRDRMGKAPLYYAIHAGRLWWCSEIKGVLAGVGPSAFAMHAEAARRFVRGGQRDFHDETFYQGLLTFPRASYAWIKPDGTFTPQTFWSLPSQRLPASELGVDEAIGGLQSRLQEAMTLRLRADVPVGVELSGGLDSSTLAVLAAKSRPASASPLSAYTIGFPGTDWDETPFAVSIATAWPQALRHRVLTPDHETVLRGLLAFQSHMDEPFHSPNMILNQDIWRRMSSEGIRVSLNGAGGDEVFAGYASEYLGPYVRHLLAQGKFAKAYNESWHNSERPDHSMREGLRALWQLLPPALRARIKGNPPSPEIDPFNLGRKNLPAASNSIENRLLDNLADTKMNYWLRSGNTSCMSVPMEVRLPLLDDRVVEWACVLPLEYLIRDGWLKWVLRKAAEPWLPSDVVWRKVKMGFPFPLASWLAQVKPTLEQWKTGEEIPFLNRRRLFDHYDDLAQKHPDYLWRCLSLLLWWSAAQMKR